MNAKVDRIISIGLILFGLGGYGLIIPYYVDKPSAGLLDELPPDLYPNMIMVAIILLGVILLTQSVWSSRLLRHQGRVSEGRVSVGKKRRAAIALSTLVTFLIAINVIGYYLASAVFLVFTMRYLGERRVWIIGLTVVLYLAFNYLLFEKGLTVILPRGIVASLVQ